MAGRTIPYTLTRSCSSAGIPAGTLVHTYNAWLRRGMQDKHAMLREWRFIKYGSPGNPREGPGCPAGLLPALPGPGRCTGGEQPCLSHYRFKVPRVS